MVGRFKSKVQTLGCVELRGGSCLRFRGDSCLKFRGIFFENLEVGFSLKFRGVFFCLKFRVFDAILPK